MPLVLDISSDDDEGLEDELKITDFDWIKDFLFTSDDEKSDDSDEVVVICEKKAELKSKSSTLPVKDVDDDDDDDDDDDCVVLEGDPENGVASVVEEATESDELVVVGEKGEIACRDYPHARHLCAKFPFSSTPHESYCTQCHCYVCDSLAPCLKWGTGILSSDHCHANDKTELWKIQRKNFKLGRSSPLPASTNHGTSLRAVCPQHNEFLSGDIIHLSPNSVLPNQASRSTAMRALPSFNPIPQIQASRPTIMCSLSPSLNSSLQNQVSLPVDAPLMSTATNVTNHGRFRESGSTLVRNRYLPHSVPRPVLGVRSHTIQRERGNGASCLRSQLLRPHVSKVTGNTLTMNNSSHGSSVLSNCLSAAQQCDKYNTATGFSSYRNYNGPNEVCHLTNLPSYSQPSSQPASLRSCVDQHTVASETQAYSPPLSQLKDIQNFHQTCIQGNTAPSSIAANGLQIRIQNENTNGNIIQCGAVSQDTCQPKPHEESPSEAARKFSAFDSSLTENTGQSIEPLIEFSPPLQSSGSIDQPSNAKESSTGFTGSKSNEPLNECSQLSNSLADFDNWYFDKDYVPMVTDGLLPSDLSIQSPDPDPVDMGMPYFIFD